MILLNLIRMSWLVYYACKYLFGPYTSTPIHLYVTGPILYTWATTSIFVLLVTLGIKRNGLRSHGQLQQLEFFNYSNPHFYPTSYGQPAADDQYHNLCQKPAFREVTASKPEL